MSTSVDPDDLASTIERYGFAYLVTIGERGAHVLAVAPVMSDSVLVVGGVGRHSRANATDRPDVTLVWPPVDPGDFSLIVDGSASVEGSTITVTPTGGILHRPAPTADGTGRAGSDCAPISS
ncbi:MAG: pyridoxamine 5'-phosphate oxidase family protein [Actinomycetota bacterium]|nr:pyridoxamine 5'-phosphate oxidase family protein [Actinomycetota bacterium]